jgi:hypothetical protein
MGKFHTDQSVPSTGTYHFAGHMENSACQPTEKEKNKQIDLNYSNSLSVIKSCLYTVLSSDRHTL